MRIVTGKLRGRNITAPSGKNTRPTSDQTRESIFNILAHADWALPLEGAIVADIFAGSGALGLEAISRGVDPPYNKGMWKPVLGRLKEQGLIAENGIIILEESKDAEIEPRGFEILADKTWGASRVLFMRVSEN